MKLPIDFKELLAEFARFEVEFVLIGGYAFAFHAEPRATKDLDVLVRAGSENQDRAARALQSFGVSSTIAESVRSQKPTEVVYFGREPARVDILQTIDGISVDEVFARCIRAEIDQVTIRVIDLESLIANKRAAGRPRDLADVERLEAVRALRAKL
jgi:predicted nucleotidyltransferase